MKAENSGEDRMRPEDDIRGGVRGKYYERYRQEHRTVITFDSPVVAKLTSAGHPEIGSITKTTTEPLVFKIQFADSMAHAG